MISFPLWKFPILVVQQYLKKIELEMSDYSNNHGEDKEMMFIYSVVFIKKVLLRLSRLFDGKLSLKGISMQRQMFHHVPMTGISPQSKKCQLMHHQKEKNKTFSLVVENDCFKSSFNCV